jgi:hypothetical protein
LSVVGGAHIMSIYENMSAGVFTPLAVRDLRIALEASFDVLARIDDPATFQSRREETRERLARRLLKHAASGETNKGRLVTYALGSLV